MKKDYTLVTRTVEELLRTYSLPILPTTLVPLTDLSPASRTTSFNLHVFRDEASLGRYREYLHMCLKSIRRDLTDSETETITPKDGVLSIMIDYWRKQYEGPNWLPSQPVAEFKVLGKTTGIESVWYGFDKDGRHGLISADVGYNGSLNHTILFPNRMDTSFREELIRLFDFYGASLGTYSIVELREPFDHAILLRFLLEKLKDGG